MLIVGCGLECLWRARRRLLGAGRLRHQGQLASYNSSGRAVTMELARDMRSKQTFVMKYVEKYAPSNFTPHTGPRHTCKRLSTLIR